VKSALIFLIDNAFGHAGVGLSYKRHILSNSPSFLGDDTGLQGEIDKVPKADNQVSNKARCPPVHLLIDDFIRQTIYFWL
jgi:hypothetical protein